MKKLIILVVAGNSGQFDYWIDQKLNELKKKDSEWERRPGRVRLENTEYIYVSKPEQMRGYHGVKVEFWGTYYERDDIDQFKQYASLAEMS